MRHVSCDLLCVSAPDGLKIIEQIYLWPVLWPALSIKVYRIQDLCIGKMMRMRSCDDIMQFRFLEFSSKELSRGEIHMFLMTDLSYDWLITDLWHIIK
jgi:hypothetical protein